MQVKYHLLQFRSAYSENDAVFALLFKGKTMSVQFNGGLKLSGTGSANAGQPFAKRYIDRVVEVLSVQNSTNGNDGYLMVRFNTMREGELVPLEVKLMLSDESYARNINKARAKKDGQSEWQGGVINKAFADFFSSELERAKEQEFVKYVIAESMAYDSEETVDGETVKIYRCNYIHNVPDNPEKVIQQYPVRARFAPPESGDKENLRLIATDVFDKYDQVVELNDDTIDDVAALLDDRNAEHQDGEDYKTPVGVYLLVYVANPDANDDPEQGDIVKSNLVIARSSIAHQTNPSKGVFKNLTGDDFRQLASDYLNYAKQLEESEEFGHYGEVKVAVATCSVYGVSKYNTICQFRRDSRHPMKFVNDSRGLLRIGDDEVMYNNLAGRYLVVLTDDKREEIRKAGKLVGEKVLKRDIIQKFFFTVRRKEITELLYMASNDPNATWASRGFVLHPDLVITDENEQNTPAPAENKRPSATPAKSSGQQSASAAKARSAQQEEEPAKPAQPARHDEIDDDIPF